MPTVMDGMPLIDGNLLLDRPVTVQTVGFGSSTPYGYNAAPSAAGQSTYLLPFTVAAGTNRCIFLYFYGNEGGTVSVATPPTYLRSGVATAMTQIIAHGGSPVSSIWYLVNPDVGTSNVSVTMSTTSYCGFAIEQWNNVHQTTPASGAQSVSKTNAQSSSSLTITTTATSSAVVAVVNGWGNTPTAVQAQTNTWISPNGESWRAWGFRIVPTASTQVMSYNWSSTSNSGTVAAFSINGVSSASPVQVGTSVSAMNLTFGAASTVSLPSSVSALTFGNNVLSLDAVNGRVGIGTSSPNASLTVSGGPIVQQRATGDNLGLLIGTSSIDNSYIRISNTTGTVDYGQGNGGAFVNVNNSQYWYVATSNTERLRITSSGNVGIGTNSPTSTLRIEGSFATKTSVGLATSTTLNDTHCVVVTPTTGAVNYILPAASTCSGRMYTIKRVTSGATTIQPQSGDTIENLAASATFTIPAQYDSYTFISGGSTTWYII